jgi:RNA polymerase sigma-70 factor (ECF subfamily)
MERKQPEKAPAVADREQFATTQWSAVLAAGVDSGQDSQDALARLCEQYWYPLYAYVRRRVNDVHEAQDLTQAFLAHLLEKQAIGKADPERGRFRAFLLTALKNFLANEWDKARAAKRGGGAAKLSLDFDTGESRFQIEPRDWQTPEDLFERRWVLTLLEQVLESLSTEMAGRGNGRQFEQLKGALTDEATEEQYESAAQALGVSAAAAKQAAYRMRKRYRQLFRAAVAQTVADESEVDDEIGRLLQALER